MRDADVFDAVARREISASQAAKLLLRRREQIHHSRIARQATRALLFVLLAACAMLAATVAVK